VLQCLGWGRGGIIGNGSLPWPLHSGRPPNAPATAADSAQKLNAADVLTGRDDAAVSSAAERATSACVLAATFAAAALGALIIL
jgi:hypothetical protein